MIFLEISIYIVGNKSIPILKPRMSKQYDSLILHRARFWLWIKLFPIQVNWSGWFLTGGGKSRIDEASWGWKIWLILCAFRLECIMLTKCSIGKDNIFWYIGLFLGTRSGPQESKGLTQFSPHAHYQFSNKFHHIEGSYLPKYLPSFNCLSFTLQECLTPSLRFTMLLQLES